MVVSHPATANLLVLEEEVIRLVPAVVEVLQAMEARFEHREGAWAVANSLLFLQIHVAAYVAFFD